MIFIAHRGNIYGPNINDENKPEYILNAIKEDYYVETDLWKVNDELYLGHDKPQYKIELNFLLNIKDKLFCHCKNIDALYYILSNGLDIECFFHDNDECVLTSKNKIWNFPGSQLTKKSICVMPERVQIYKIEKCLGICSDYPYKYKEMYNI